MGRHRQSRPFNQGVGGSVPRRLTIYSVSIYRYPICSSDATTLRLIGWPLYRVASVVQWCRPRLEFIPVPDEGEWVRMVPEHRRCSQLDSDSVGDLASMTCERGARVSTALDPRSE